MRGHVGLLRSQSRQATNLRELRDHGNLAGACQKVIECLYIILPSFNMYLITFWHNSALAFILGWWPNEMSSRPASSRPAHKSRPAEIMTTYQVQWPCQKVSECLYITLPSYNMYLITFWHNSALAFILGWWPYEMSSLPAEISASSHKSRPADFMATYQVQWPCQKVSECLYITLPSYNM